MPAWGWKVRGRRSPTRRRGWALAVLFVVFVLQVPPAPSDAVTIPLCASPVVAWQGGHRAGRMCPEEAAERGLTIVDLSDEWAPRTFAEDPSHPRGQQPYRRTMLDLAAGRGGPDDRYLELFGISPAFALLEARLRDDARHRCHDEVDDGALRRAIVPSGRGARGVGVLAIQAHLRCDGLLGPEATRGVLDDATAHALALYQQQHVIVGLHPFDESTQLAMLTDSRELDFLALLRALRERVVDAAGLIEDGTARGDASPVVGRFLDPPRLRPFDAEEPLPGAAPDLIGLATDRAARALGWTGPQAARAFFEMHAPGTMASMRVAVPLPAAPPWHRRHMELRVEIDRGDVWYDFPYAPDGTEIPQPIERKPSLVVYAQYGADEIPLVRWPTTIGGWKLKQDGRRDIVFRYKHSHVGTFYWRDLVAAPAWLPPDTTPDGSLLRSHRNGMYSVREDIVGPGHRSAFGLVMLVHERDRNGRLVDDGIRTHGSGDYRSIVAGQSSGCHRLFSHLANRLSAFLLAHRDHRRHGLVRTGFVRRVHSPAGADEIRVRDRGHRYELTPPVQIDVLEGRIRGTLREPPTRPIPVPPSLRGRLPEWIEPETS